MMTKEKIDRFIRDNFYLPDDIELTHDTSLPDQGIVDSTGMLEIISFLERTFAIQVPDDEILPDNFDTIERIAAYVELKSTKVRHVKLSA
jgi:acyl carrier protein